jgi:hypothetical protein
MLSPLCESQDAPRRKKKGEESKEKKKVVSFLFLFLPSAFFFSDYPTAANPMIRLFLSKADLILKVTRKGSIFSLSTSLFTILRLAFCLAFSPSAKRL